MYELRYRKLEDRRGAPRKISFDTLAEADAEFNRMEEQMRRDPRTRFIKMCIYEVTERLIRAQ